MTSPEPVYADRCYRSGGALAGGVLLLGLAAWLGGDALLRGEGRTPAVAAAALLCAVPLIVAFTLRPAVYAGAERLRVRNPFRTITLPWGSIELIRAAYSCEVVADGVKYQLWSIPVSLRERKKANRHNQRLESGRPPRGVLGLGSVDADQGPRQAPSDRTVEELRELAERHAKKTGTPTVRWAYEIIAPAAAGALALAVLLLTA
ncbi:PH domain-containing protein [Streptomyces alkaliterrae]|uniref:PH domain-containing protein n=1 Tax=Streptomyces alkaliterrae TaxID=2213162 RepID=A0A5P0YT17_9ACTN|nr:PH domain-containing protein [Streptomyces alkaliterrae]MBB1253567.1 PH domain-containing protein [Streptomyces alkaliterrae]MBB1258975.1 PH domain-containing protein [Streptomyces alkaliterrae]MQS03050.1 PH domain-containing protein [Streptomyces alkaliterrae]